MTYKRDLFHMTPEQVRAGREMWKVTGQKGRLAHSSFDAEAMAPKTWIMWVNNKGEEIHTIECELYVVPRRSGAEEQVGCLIGMCPVCGEHFTVTEDNKQMSLDWVTYRKAPKHLRINWAFHCKNVLAKPVMDDDLIPVVSSGERWVCAYKRDWCVRVHGGVATTDMTGVTQLSVSDRTPIIGGDR
jgi:hypothetical protein